MLNFKNLKMKKNNFKYQLFFLTILLFSITGCENLEEINIDPNRPKDVDLGLIFTSGEEKILYKYGRFTNGTDWDTWSGLWIQTFAGNHGAGVNYDRYDLQAVNSTWGTQYDGFNDLNEVIKRGTEIEAWEHVAASKVLISLGLGTLTSVYGDLPWSEALKGSEIPYPIFDSQESIYASMMTLLDQAIEDLAKNSSISLGNNDFAYNGDTNKWKGLAYALKARYENHFSIKAPQASANAALQAVTNAKQAGFTMPESDLTFPYAGEDKYLNGWFHMFENNQMVASEVFMNYLENTNDPRKFAYWNDKNTDGDTVGYLGKPNALGTTNISYSPVGPQGYYGKKDSPQLIVTHFELLFIESEAAFRSGDLAKAALSLNEAIIKQIDLVMPASRTYLTENGDVDAFDLMITNYKNANANETASSITLEKIMTQKYISMFTMNTESWNDVRRHNYQFPSYLSIPNTPEGVPIGDQFIQRVLYPQESTNTNQNTPESNIFSPLWIFN